MSYEHRGLIIGVKQKLLYVLPIFSYDSTKYPDVFHPIDSPNSKSEMLLLKSSEFVFINHDSVLKLNDIRTVSVNRILYQHSGRIDPASKTYMLIESLCLRKYFPVFYHEYEKNTTKNEKDEYSAADELMKYAELYKKGLLNEEEFTALKKKLLRL